MSTAIFDEPFHLGFDNPTRQKKWPLHATDREGLGCGVKRPGDLNTIRTSLPGVAVEQDAGGFFGTLYNAVELLFADAFKLLFVAVCQVKLLLFLSSIHKTAV
jgi:hypothetical protein